MPPAQKAGQLHQFFLFQSGCLSVTLRIIVLFPTCTSPVSRIFNISPLFYPFSDRMFTVQTTAPPTKSSEKEKCRDRSSLCFSFSASAYSYAAASPEKLWPPSQWPSVRNALSLRRPLSLPPAEMISSFSAKDCASHRKSEKTPALC